MVSLNVFIVTTSNERILLYHHDSNLIHWDGSRRVVRRGSPDQIKRDATRRV